MVEIGNVTVGVAYVLFDRKKTGWEGWDKTDIFKMDDGLVWKVEAYCSNTLDGGCGVTIGEDNRSYQWCIWPWHEMDKHRTQVNHVWKSAKINN